MQPLERLDDDVIVFIENNFTREQQNLISTAVYLLHRFDMSHYEDQLTTLVVMDIETEEKRHILFDTLTTTMRAVIYQHAITLDDDGVPTINELCEILSFLSIVQSLEDFYIIKGRLFSLDVPRYVFADLLEQLSELQSYRALEIIKDVDKNLIKAIQQIALKKENDYGDCDLAYLRNFDRFTKFLNGQDLLALRMFRDGYRNLDYADLLHLSPYPVDKYITNRMAENTTLACLELVGLLLLSRDSYEVPLNHIDTRLSMFTGTITEQENMKRLITAIVGDYSSFIMNGEHNG